MTPDLVYLAYATLLTALLWVPYIIGLAMTNSQLGISPAATYKDPTPPELPNWVKRANRAHINSVETLAPIAILLVIAHITGANNEQTALWALVFLCARLAHAVVYWVGVPFLRTLAFVTGLAATLGVFYEIVTAAPAV
ncbi:MAG: MAPEG family protein [Pseudomonadota bacterium]